MREHIKSLRVLLGIGFKAAPWHAAMQMLTGMLFELAPPLLAYGAKLLIDAAVEQDLDRALLAAGLMAFGMAGGIALVIAYIRCAFMVYDRANAFADRRMMELVGGAPGMMHHEHPEYLDQIERIREERWRLAGMVNAMSGLLRVTAMVSSSATLLASVHPALLLLPLVGIVSFLMGKRATDLWNEANEATSEGERLRRHLFEIATAEESGKELRVFGTAGELLRRHHEVSDQVIGVRNRADWRGAWGQAADGVLSGMAYAAAIGLVLWEAVHGSATVGDVVLAVGLAATVNNMVGTAVAYGTQYLRTNRLGQRFVWLDRYAAEHTGTPADPVEPPSSLRAGIEFRDVHFRYPGTMRPVLDGVSLSLPAGSVVAIVGENGAGKTSLVKLLSRFYEPDAGAIVIDDVELSRMPVAQWRARVSATYQDHAAFEFVAREVVGVGNLPRISDEVAVQRALHDSGGRDVVAGLPRGLATQLGAEWDDGVDLSGGQWQKLALARGLMRTEPLLVVFDEPTSALDPQTEHDLFARFAAAARSGGSRGTVTVLVSHRFSTVQMADLIVVLDGGHIVEQGSHAELMAAGGTYAELYELQSRAYR